MKIGYIYKITSPNGKIYIGQTKDPVKRISTYRKCGCKQQPKIYNSIKKYGWEFHKFEIIENIIFDLKVLNEREIYWIKYFDSMNEGLNCTGGGYSKQLSPETIEKIRQSKLGKPSPFKGKKLTEEQKLKISKSLIGNTNNRFCKK